MILRRSAAGLPPPVDLREDESRPPDTAQHLRRPAISQIVVCVLLGAFVALLLLDISIGDVTATGLNCAVNARESLLKCDYVMAAASHNVVGTLLHYRAPLFGKQLDFTVCFGLASLLYAIRHASLGSTPFITYTCQSETTETGERWLAKIRNDGLGPAIRPASRFWITPSSRNGGALQDSAWLDADRAREVLTRLFAGTGVEFHPLGSGGAIAKDKEFTIFSCDRDDLAALEGFYMSLSYEGQYGSRFHKMVVLVPTRTVRTDEEGGTGGVGDPLPIRAEPSEPAPGAAEGEP